MSVWFRHVVAFVSGQQIGMLSLSGLGRFSVFSGFSIQDCKVCLVQAGFLFSQGSVDRSVKSVFLGQAGFRFSQGSVDRTVKSVWVRQVFDFLRVQQIGLQSLSGLGRFLVFPGFSRQDCKVCLGQAGFRFTQGSVDGTVKSVWFRQAFGFLRVQYIGL